MLKRIALCALLLLPALSQAELLLGIGYVNGMVGPNLEWAWQRHTAYVQPGAHLGDYGLEDDELRWVAGMRYRIDQGTTVTSGFFTGLMVGDLGGERQYERLGIGGELGHQWMGNYLRLTISGGMAVLEELRERDLDVEPQFLLGVTLSVRR
ncbi:hypothetical protein [Alcanivorax quisquiliarum]|uniref:Outer membrane protein beta-barrel domain-containing protein n=1 Tax=Alcanivorax quisquiliarum TaxID=2933565 RepID=A0ABT0E9B8_9GAMM|nr:hypothetical protein [Alcanivorax quisquiliarum]MCK0538434.1 hypothetical protein [Alcanivorax quisquiliarum]